MTLHRHSRPKLAPKARLRWDRFERRHLLLYPERGLLLGRTAARILELCSGTHTVAQVIERLVAEYPQADRAAIERDIDGFLGQLELRGLLEIEAEEP